MIYPAQVSTASTGQLRINLTTSVGFSPVEGARITISTTGTGGTGNVIEELTTNNSGQTEIIEVPAPDLGLSLEPSDEQPYSEYTITVNAEGYQPVVVAGTQVLPTREAIQPISLNPISNTGKAPSGGTISRTEYSYENAYGVLRDRALNRTQYRDKILSSQEIPTPAPPVGKSIVIGPHTLYGDYPPKIPESEVKSVDETGAIVLTSVVIPEFVIVHDGPPNDASATNYYVRFSDYIKNVASSEIYATWPSATIQANILAITSVCLNRVFTEWYFGKGFNFTITSSTAFDQKFIYGRNIYDNISKEVDALFTTYLSRPNVLQPIMTQYCDGVRTSCASRGWMTQWGSKDLGDQGLSNIEIIRRFYGNDMYINSAPAVAGVPSSFPGQSLRVGSTGEPVRTIQQQLNRISDNYPAIPKVRVDGNFGPQTEAAVKKFQQIFDLTQDGIVGKDTWYRISNIYVAVTRLAELK